LGSVVPVLAAGLDESRQGGYAPCRPHTLDRRVEATPLLRRSRTRTLAAARPLLTAYRPLLPSNHHLNLHCSFTRRQKAAFPRSTTSTSLLNPNCSRAHKASKALLRLSTLSGSADTPLSYAGLRPLEPASLSVGPPLGRGFFPLGQSVRGHAPWAWRGAREIIPRYQAPTFSHLGNRRE